MYTVCYIIIKNYLLDQDGQTALHYAALNGCTAAVEVLLAAGAYLNIQTKVVCCSLHAYHFFLCGVVYSGLFLYSCHTHLIAAAQQQGQTPLMLAALKGHAAAMQSLIEAGADMNIQDKVSGYDTIWMMYDYRQLVAGDTLLWVHAIVCPCNHIRFLAWWGKSNVLQSH